MPQKCRVMPQSRAKEPGGGSVGSEESMSNGSDTSTSITSPVLSAEGSQGSQSSYEEHEREGQNEGDVEIVTEIAEARQEMKEIKQDAVKLSNDINSIHIDFLDVLQQFAAFEKISSDECQSKTPSEERQSKIPLEERQSKVPSVEQRSKRPLDEHGSKTPSEERRSKTPDERPTKTASDKHRSKTPSDEPKTENLKIPKVVKQKSPVDQENNNLIKSVSQQDQYFNQDMDVYTISADNKPRGIQSKGGVNAHTGTDRIAHENLQQNSSTEKYEILTDSDNANSVEKPEPPSIETVKQQEADFSRRQPPKKPPRKKIPAPMSEEAKLGRQSLQAKHGAQTGEKVDRSMRRRDALYQLPTHSAPIHSAPTHSAPTHSAPTHSAPTHSAPTHSAPSHSTHNTSHQMQKSTRKVVEWDWGNYTRSIIQPMVQPMGQPTGQPTTDSNTSVHSRKSEQQSLQMDTKLRENVGDIEKIQPDANQYQEATEYEATKVHENETLYNLHQASKKRFASETFRKLPSIEHDKTAISDPGVCKLERKGAMRRSAPFKPEITTKTEIFDSTDNAKNLKDATAKSEVNNNDYQGENYQRVAQTSVPRDTHVNKYKFPADHSRLKPEKLAAETWQPNTKTAMDLSKPGAEIENSNMMRKLSTNEQEHRNLYDNYADANLTTKDDSDPDSISESEGEFSVSALDPESLQAETTDMPRYEINSTMDSLDLSAYISNSVNESDYMNDYMDDSEMKVASDSPEVLTNILAAVQSIERNEHDHRGRKLAEDIKKALAAYNKQHNNEMHKSRDQNYRDGMSRDHKSRDWSRDLSRDWSRDRSREKSRDHNLGTEKHSELKAQNQRKHKRKRRLNSKTQFYNLDRKNDMRRKVRDLVRQKSSPANPPSRTPSLTMKFPHSIGDVTIREKMKALTQKGVRERQTDSPRKLTATKIPREHVSQGMDLEAAFPSADMKLDKPVLLPRRHTYDDRMIRFDTKLMHTDSTQPAPSVNRTLSVTDRKVEIKQTVNMQNEEDNRMYCRTAPNDEKGTIIMKQICSHEDQTNNPKTQDCSETKVQSRKDGCNDEAEDHKAEDHIAEDHKAEDHIAEDHIAEDHKAEDHKAFHYSDQDKIAPLSKYQHDDRKGEAKILEDIEQTSDLNNNLFEDKNDHRNQRDGSTEAEGCNDGGFSIGSCEMASEESRGSRKHAQHLRAEGLFVNTGKNSHDGKSEQNYDYDSDMSVSNFELILDECSDEGIASERVLTRSTDQHSSDSDIFCRTAQRNSDSDIFEDSHHTEGIVDVSCHKSSSDSDIFAESPWSRAKKNETDHDASKVNDEKVSPEILATAQRSDNKDKRSRWPGNADEMGVDSQELQTKPMKRNDQEKSADKATEIKGKLQLKREQALRKRALREQDILDRYSREENYTTDHNEMTNNVTSNHSSEEQEKFRKYDQDGQVNQHNAQSPHQLYQDSMNEISVDTQRHLAQLSVPSLMENFPDDSGREDDFEYPPNGQNYDGLLQDFNGIDFANLPSVSSFCSPSQDQHFLEDNDDDDNEFQKDDGCNDINQGGHQLNDRTNRMTTIHTENSQSKQNPPGGQVRNTYNLNVINQEDRTATTHKQNPPRQQNPLQVLNTNNPARQKLNPQRQPNQPSLSGGQILNTNNLNQDTYIPKLDPGAANIPTGQDTPITTASEAFDHSLPDISAITHLSSMTSRMQLSLMTRHSASDILQGQGHSTPERDKGNVGLGTPKYETRDHRDHRESPEREREKGGIGNGRSKYEAQQQKHRQSPEKGTYYTTPKKSRRPSPEKEAERGKERDREQGIGPQNPKYQTPRKNRRPSRDRNQDQTKYETPMKNQRPNSETEEEQEHETPMNQTPRKNKNLRPSPLGSDTTPRVAIYKIPKSVKPTSCQNSHSCSDCSCMDDSTPMNNAKVRRQGASVTSGEDESTPQVCRHGRLRPKPMSLSSDTSASSRGSIGRAESKSLQQQPPRMSSTGRETFLEQEEDNSKASLEGTRDSEAHASLLSLPPGGHNTTSTWETDPDYSSDLSTSDVHMSGLSSCVTSSYKETDDDGQWSGMSGGIGGAEGREAGGGLRGIGGSREGDLRGGDHIGGAGGLRRDLGGVGLKDGFGGADREGGSRRDNECNSRGGFGRRRLLHLPPKARLPPRPHRFNPPSTSTSSRSEHILAPDNSPNSTERWADNIPPNATDRWPDNIPPNATDRWADNINPAVSSTYWNVSIASSFGSSMDNLSSYIPNVPLQKSVLITQARSMENISGVFDGRGLAQKRSIDVSGYDRRGLRHQRSSENIHVIDFNCPNSNHPDNPHPFEFTPPDSNPYHHQHLARPRTIGQELESSPSFIRSQLKSRSFRAATRKSSPWPEREVDRAVSDNEGQILDDDQLTTASELHKANTELHKANSEELIDHHKANTELTKANSDDFELQKGNSEDLAEIHKANSEDLIVGKKKKSTFLTKIKGLKGLKKHFRSNSMRQKKTGQSSGTSENDDSGHL